MNMPVYEKGITAALQQAVDGLNGQTDVAVNVRIGTMTLDDGRDAQIQLMVTVSPDDFIEEGK